jgi:hypothetical protein
MFLVLQFSFEITVLARPRLDHPPSYPGFVDRPDESGAASFPVTFDPRIEAFVMAEADIMVRVMERAVKMNEIDH